MIADMILTNGHICTMDEHRTFVSAVAIRNGRFIGAGTDGEMMAYRGGNTTVIDLGGRTVIPGLIDSHIHVIRGGLNYNMELRWDGVPSLAEALEMLREQAKRTPPPHWVRVVGGWSEFQFEERRMPTLDEINEAAPDTPVFVLHLYHCALLNRAALRAAGYTKDTPDPQGGEIQRDDKGNPTGLLLAKPNALILYSTLAKAPKLSYDDQINSTRQFMRELNRFGVTGAIDAGGGFQNYPEDYRVISDLAKKGLLTIRIAYNLFTQRPGHELENFANWIKMTEPGEGDDFYRMNGAGEMLVFSAADFENFPESRPELPTSLEAELKDVVRLLVQNRWRFRLHATYNESITRFLNVLEEVNREVPFNGLRWFLCHAETISQHNIERVHALGGGIGIQDRMAFQGEHFIARYGAGAAEQAPPVARMIEMGVPVGGGTDATRVASYNPFVALYWLVTGRTVGETTLYPEENRPDRMEALRLFTTGSAWFSNEEDKKGSIEAGKFADLAVLSADYFSVPEDQIRKLESVLTIVNGKVVYGTGEFGRLAPPPLPVSPSWSPVVRYCGYWRPAADPPVNSGEFFQSIYRGVPPWDIGRPQPEFVRLAKAGGIKGTVLDAGCGTGENALYLAGLGYEVWGIDIVPDAIEKARAKAQERGVKATFLVADALELQNLGKMFDTVIDCGLFHVFSDEERPLFVRSLASVLRPGGTYYMLCFSEHEPGTWGPRRVTQAEIRAAFSNGWKINYIREAYFETNLQPDRVRAWLSSITRMEDDSFYREKT